jgi:hypothetical protein
MHKTTGPDRRRYCGAAAATVVARHQVFPVFFFHKGAQP